jgi:septin family protein
MSENIVGRFVNDFRFEHPFCTLISGTTGVGKSTFVKNLIERDGIKGNIREIYYFMPEIEKISINVPQHQKLYLMEGIPTKEWISKNWTVATSNKDVLFIVDDQWDDVLKDKTCKRLCSWGRNHLGFSTLFVTQYYFEQANMAQMMK